LGDTEVIDLQPHTFLRPQPAAGERPCHQLTRIRQAVEETTQLLPRKWRSVCAVRHRELDRGV
jgi:hypothetical protein